MTSMTAETRKLVQNPQVDRRIIKNPHLAAELDSELKDKDVTTEELARVNAALKKVMDEARGVAVRGGPDEERFVTHAPTATCGIAQEHSTLRSNDSVGCGYFRAPREWIDVLRAVVRSALAG